MVAGETEGRSVWGLIGLGARGFTPASCSAEGEGLVITVTRSHMSKPVQDTLDVLKPTKVRRPSLLCQHTQLASHVWIIIQFALTFPCSVSEGRRVWQQDFEVAGR